MIKTRRVRFEFDERSLVSIKTLKEQGAYCMAPVPPSLTDRAIAAVGNVADNKTVSATETKKNLVLIQSVIATHLDLINTRLGRPTVVRVSAPAPVGHIGGGDSLGIERIKHPMFNFQPPEPPEGFIREHFNHPVSSDPPTDGFWLPGQQ